MSGYRVESPVGELRPQYLRGKLRWVSPSHPPFYPYLPDLVILPVGEQADAVAASEDLLQVVLQLVDGQVLINHLTDLKGWLHLECDLGDNADCTQVHGHPLESFAIVLSGENQHITIRRYHFQPGNSRGQVAIFVPRAVGRRSNGARDRNLG